MSHKPSVYAELLAHRMNAHSARCILLNTGWSGGPYGVGDRMSIAHTRALLNAALNGEFDAARTVRLPILGLRIPETCPGVPDEILNPRNTWSDPQAYDEAAIGLRDLFRQNYAEKNYADLSIKAVL